MDIQLDKNIAITVLYGIEYGVEKSMKLIPLIGSLVATYFVSDSLFYPLTSGIDERCHMPLPFLAKGEMPLEPKIFFGRSFGTRETDIEFCQRLSVRIDDKIIPVQRYLLPFASAIGSFALTWATMRIQWYAREARIHLEQQ